MEEGGKRVKAMEIGATIVSVAETVLVGLAVEVAVMVTVLPAGTEAGAVNAVVAPLAVCAGLNEPQLDAPQLTVQSRPLFCGSLATVAPNVA